MKKILFSILILFSCYLSFSQNKLDSLRNVISTSKVDSARVNSLNQLSQFLLKISKNAARDTINLAIKLSKKSNYHLGLGTAYKNKAILFYYTNSPDSAFIYFDKAINEFEFDKDLENKAKIYNNIGLIYRSKGKYDSAIVYYEKAIEFFKKSEDKRPIMVIANNLGTIYMLQSDYQRALDVCIDGMKVFDKLTDKNSLDSERLGYLYNTIAQINTYQKKFENAINYYNKALNIFQKIQSTQDMADIYINLGNVKGLEAEVGNNKKVVYSFFDFEPKLPKNAKELNKEALSYYLKAANLYKVNDKIALANYNVASAYIYLKELDSAKKFIDVSFDLYSKMNDVKGIALSQYLYGSYYKQKNLYDEALKNYLPAYETFKKIGEINNLSKITNDLYLTYKAIGNYQKSLQFLEESTSAKDSIFSASNEQKLTEMSLTYQFDKEKQQTELKYQEQLKRQRIIQIFAFVVIVLFMIVLIAVYAAFRLKKRKNEELQQLNAEITLQKEEIEAQRDEIEDQKNQIEEQSKELEIQRDLAIVRGNELEKKNQDIEASIHYALRIQQAILPSVELLDNFFDDKFIFYKPRDIVSGDFYWISQKAGKIYVVAADCTGHGVPGAFMSLLGISFLNQIIAENHSLSTMEILNSLREMIIEALKQSTKDFESSRDGMDLAIIQYDKTNQTVEYSGAYNSAFVVSENKITVENDDNVRHLSSENTNKKLYEIKADRMPIGIYVTESKSFNLKIFKVAKNDRIYIFSDGYQDMYNKGQNEKFTSRRFKKLLLETSSLKMSEQKEKLENSFYNWIGDSKQIDDVLVVGLKI